MPSTDVQQSTLDAVQYFYNNLIVVLKLFVESVRVAGHVEIAKSRIHPLTSSPSIPFIFFSINILSPYKRSKRESPLTHLVSVRSLSVSTSNTRNSRWVRALAGIKFNNRGPHVSHFQSSCTRCYWMKNRAQIKKTVSSFTFRRFRKIAKSDLASSCLSACLSVRPSARMEQFCSHWTDFHDILYLRIFKKSVAKIQVSLKYVRNNRYFT